MNEVHVFDFSGTIAESGEGIEAFMAANPKVKKGWGENKFYAMDAIARAARPMSMHVEGKTVSAAPYPSTIPYFESIKSRGDNVAVFSSGNRYMIRQELWATGLLDYVNTFYSSTELNRHLKPLRADILKKLTDDYMTIALDFDAGGKSLAAVFDDKVHNVVSAMFASQEVSKRAGVKPFKAYLIVRDSSAKIGLTKYGFYVINDFEDVEKIESAEEEGNPLQSDFESEDAESRIAPTLEDKVEEHEEHNQDHGEHEAEHEEHADAA